MPLLCRRPADPIRVDPPVPPMPPISMTSTDEDREAEAA